MPNTPTYYELLGVRATATVDEIHAAYHAAIRHYHPDVNKAPNAEQITTMINQAWGTLRDPLARARYDREIRPRPEPVRPPQPPPRPQPQAAQPPWSGGYTQSGQWSNGYSQQRAQWSGTYSQQRPQWSNNAYWQRRTTVSTDPDLIGAMAGRVIGRTARMVGIIAVGIVGIAMFTHLLPYFFPLAIGFFILRRISCTR